MAPEDEALRLLSRGLIDIRATAWGAVVGTDPEAQLMRVAMIANALHNLPGAVRVGTAADALAWASTESPSGQWLTSERELLAREGQGRA